MEIEWFTTRKEKLFVGALVLILAIAGLLGCYLITSKCACEESTLFPGTSIEPWPPDKGVSPILYYTTPLYQYGMWYEAPIIVIADPDGDGDYKRYFLPSEAQVIFRMDAEEQCWLGITESYILHINSSCQ